MKRIINKVFLLLLRKSLGLKLRNVSFVISKGGKRTSSRNFSSFLVLDPLDDPSLLIVEAIFLKFKLKKSTPVSTPFYAPFINSANLILTLLGIFIRNFISTIPINLVTQKYTFNFRNFYVKLMHYFSILLILYFSEPNLSRDKLMKKNFIQLQIEP